MIPISLTIKGLYSYQAEQRIDFANLTEAQLFGIFGTVGSGKSTILEAISFALYNETERMNSRENRNYNMLNLRSNELLVDFTFRNHDNHSYRFVVKGKRNRNNFNAVGSFDRSAYKLKEDEEHEVLEFATAESIIGLSYENFRRTIIIPQGKFQEFLQLGDTARTNMLKEIFQLERFEFFRQTSSLESKNNDKLNQLSGQLLQLEAVTIDSVNAKKDEVRILAEAHSQLITSMQKLEEEETELTALHKQLEDFQAKQKEQQDLKKKEVSIDELDQRIHQYEYCQLHFKPLFDSEKSNLANDLLKRSAYDSAVANLANLAEQSNRDNERLKIVSAAFESLELRRKEKEDYSNLIQLKAIDKSIGDLKKEQVTVNETMIAAESEKKESLAKVSDLKNQIRTLKEALPDLQELSQVQNWFALSDTLNVREESERMRISENKEALNSIYVATFDGIPVQLREEFPFSDRPAIEQYYELLQNAEKTSSETITQLQTKKNELNVQSKLSEFTDQIEEGKACLLCGSFEHPQILHIDSVVSDLKEVDDDIAAIQSKKTLLVEAMQICVTSSTRLKDLQLSIDSAEARLEEIVGEIKQHRNGFNWPQFSAEDKGRFEIIQQQAIDTQHTLRQLEDSLSSAENEQTLANDSFEKARAQRDHLESELRAFTAQRMTFESLIKTLDATAFVLDEASIIEKIAELTDHISETESDYKTLTEAIQATMLRQATYITTRDTAKEDLDRLESELSTIRAGIAAALSNSSFTNRNEVEQIILQTIDVEEAKQQITLFRQQLFSLNQEIVRLQSAFDGKQFDQLRFDQVKTDLVDLRAQVEEKNNLKIAGETLLEKMNAEWEDKQLLMAEESKLQHRKSNIQTLKKLFISSGFVNYISSVYLQQLCKAANERFYKLTKQQLRLEVTENNTFQVRDFLNEGRVRSAKTLSGGQTFQASLCLALALAESIPQQSRASQNFFFLDEGFGSQDKESLRTVFESLKALRQENRIVGVISHVEELQQEIDAYLTIVNHAEHGSIVNVSWNN